jgi:hypothetical protein
MNLAISWPVYNSKLVTPVFIICRIYIKELDCKICKRKLKAVKIYSAYGNRGLRISESTVSISYTFR